MMSDQDSAPGTPTKTQHDSTPIQKQRMINLSDSDLDSDLENDNGDQSYLAGLNVPERLKNILRYKDIGNSSGALGDEDNTDSDDDGDLFMRPSLLKTPDRPSTTTTATTPTITAKSTVRLAPVEKDTPRLDQKNRFEQLLAMALGDSTDDENDGIETIRKKQPTKKTPKESKKPTKKTTAAQKKKKKKPTTKKIQKPKAKDSDDDDQVDQDTSSATDSDTDVSSTPQRKGKSTKKKNSATVALLEDTDDSDSDDDQRPKQLSRKAKLEMERETQRLRRATHVKLQPRMVRKTIDDLVLKLESDQQDELVERSVTPDEIQTQPSPQAHQSPTRVSIYEKYKKELEKLERFNSNMNDDEDDGLIVVNTETRGTRFIKSVLSAISHEPPSPLRENNATRRSIGKSPASPMALRTLNQQLIAKMGQEQQVYRQEGIEKAKALGLYVSPEERAKQHMEREQEAAVLDLEVQRLLYRKSVQQNQRSNNSEDDEGDEDYVLGNDDEDRLILSGEEGDSDRTDDSDNNDNSEHEDEDDDGPVILKRRNRLVQKQRNPFLLDEDEEAELAARQRKAPKAPEPANSIANFFMGKSNRTNMDDDITGSPTTDGPRSLTRLMQRTLIEDDTEDMDISAAVDEEHQNRVEDDEQADEGDQQEDTQHDAENEQPSRLTTPVPTKRKERNDYVEEEAEEEDDEYYGLGGPDIAETADLDRFEEDGMLIHDKDNNETVDSAQIQAEYHKNMLEKDQHMVERLIKDITGGGLRRKRAAAAAGLLLDDYDLYDDDESRDDLVALRLALANKRKKMMKGDPMNYLASDPKTAAFARAAMPTAGALDLSGDEDEDEDGEEEEEEENGDDDDKDDRNLALGNGTNYPSGMVDLDDYTDEDQDEPIKFNINMVVGDYTEPWTRRPDNPAEV